MKQLGPTKPHKIMNIQTIPIINCRIKVIVIESTIQKWRFYTKDCRLRPEDLQVSYRSQLTPKISCQLVMMETGQQELEKSRGIMLKTYKNSLHLPEKMETFKTRIPGRYGGYSLDNIHIEIMKIHVSYVV